MEELEHQEQSIELLKELGLKEYEAKSFVALSRLPQGTAKQISEISDVPRTRVYDSTQVLEEKGLVEVHHSKPRQFRTVAIDEAMEIFRSEYTERIESLRDRLQRLEPASVEDKQEITHEVWALSGSATIHTRVRTLIDDAQSEVVLVVGSERGLSEGIVEGIQAAQSRGVTVVVGTVDESLQGVVQDRLPDVEVFVSGLDWLSGSVLPGDDTLINQLLLADRSTILASSVTGDPATEEEHGVFGRGFDNGLVTIVRRLMVTGLLSGNDLAE